VRALYIPLDYDLVRLSISPAKKRKGTSGIDLIRAATRLVSGVTLIVVSQMTKAVLQYYVIRIARLGEMRNTHHGNWELEHENRE